MNAVIAEDLGGDGFWMATEVEDHVQIGPDLFLREAGECGDLEVEFWRGLARVGVVCGVLAMFAVCHVNVSESMNK